MKAPPLALALLATAALAAEPSSGLSSPPKGWVDLTSAVPGVRLDIRYHLADNFTGAPLPGYGAADAWLMAGPAADLARVQADLAAEGKGLLVYDAYRPLRGTLAMVAWATRPGQTALLDNGYIARRSNHNRGNTIDLTVIDLATGAPLDMGVPFDTLDDRAHTRNATGEVLDRRLHFVELMRRHGWVNYWKEWWHFTWHPDDDPAPVARDVPYGCFEPAEGAWKPPSGWNMPGWTAPAAVTEPNECR